MEVDEPAAISLDDGSIHAVPIAESMAAADSSIISLLTSNSSIVNLLNPDSSISAPLNEDSSQADLLAGDSYIDDFLPTESSIADQSSTYNVDPLSMKTHPTGDECKTADSDSSMQSLDSTIISEDSTLDEETLPSFTVPNISAEDPNNDSLPINATPSSPPHVEYNILHKRSLCGGDLLVDTWDFHTPSRLVQRVQELHEDVSSAANIQPAWQQ